MIVSDTFFNKLKGDTKAGIYQKRIVKKHGNPTNMKISTRNQNFDFYLNNTKLFEQKTTRNILSDIYQNSTEHFEQKTTRNSVSDIQQNSVLVILYRIKKEKEKQHAQVRTANLQQGHACLRPLRHGMCTYGGRSFLLILSQTKE